MAFHPGIDTVFYIHVDMGHLRRPREAHDHDGSQDPVVVGPGASEGADDDPPFRGPRSRGIRVNPFNEIVDL